MPEQPPGTLPADFFQGGQGTPPDTLPADFDFSAGGVRKNVMTPSPLAKSFDIANVGRSALGGVEGMLSPLRSLVYDPATQQPQAANVARQTIEGLKATPSVISKGVKERNLGGLLGGILGPMALGGEVAPAGDVAGEAADTIINAKPKLLQRIRLNFESGKEFLEGVANKRHDAAQTKMAAVVNQLDPLVNFNANIVKGAVIKQLGQLSNLESLPPTLQRMLKDSSDNWSFKKLLEYRTDLGREAFDKGITDVHVAKVGRDTYHNLGEMLEQGANRVSPHAGDDWKVASGDWAQYMNKFERGPIGDMRRAATPSAFYRHVTGPNADMVFNDLRNEGVDPGDLAKLSSHYEKSSTLTRDIPWASGGNWQTLTKAVGARRVEQGARAGFGSLRKVKLQENPWKP